MSGHIDDDEDLDPADEDGGEGAPGGGGLSREVRALVEEAARASAPQEADGDDREDREDREEADDRFAEDEAPVELGEAPDVVLDEAADEDIPEDDPGTELEIPDWLPAACEALVFCSTEAMTPGRIREVLKGEGDLVDVRVIRRCLRDLVASYEAGEVGHGRGVRLVETGGTFTFRTVPQVSRFLRRFFEARPQRLSRAALETLSIIAYRQPVTRPQIDDIRGVDCSGAIKNLMDRKLIRILGKADEVGRPLIYGTTKHFLDFFQLKSLSDLPTLREYHELEGGGPEPLPDTAQPPSGPVTVMDLFDSQGSGELVSDDTEAESRKALAALEAALGEASEVTRVAQAVADAGAGGPLPIDLPLVDARRQAARALLDEDEELGEGADDDEPLRARRGPDPDDEDAPGAGEAPEHDEPEGAAEEDADGDLDDDGLDDEGADEDGLDDVLEDPEDEDDRDDEEDDEGEPEASGGAPA